MPLKLVADVKYKKKELKIYRDQNGKWTIIVDGVVTQKRLNASEIVRWLANAMYEE